MSHIPIYKSAKNLTLQSPFINIRAFKYRASCMKVVARGFFGASKKVLCVEVFKSKRGFCNFKPARCNVCVCVCVCMNLASWKRAAVANSGIEERFETPGEIAGMDVYSIRNRFVSIWPSLPLCSPLRRHN
jgi:hypothetical protein